MINLIVIKLKFFSIQHTLLTESNDAKHEAVAINFLKNLSGVIRIVRMYY